ARGTFASGLGQPPEAATASIRPWTSWVGLVLLLVVCAACSGDDKPDDNATSVSAPVSVEDGGGAVLRTASVEIPKGGVASDTTLNLRVVKQGAVPSLPEFVRSAGTALDVSLDEGELSKPATLAFRFDPRKLPKGVTRDLVMIGTYDEKQGQWRFLPSKV